MAEKKIKKKIVNKGKKETSAKTTQTENVLEEKETVKDADLKRKFEKIDPSSLPTSLIMSGVESDRYWNIVVDQCGMKTVLMSYQYIQKKPKDFLAKRLEKYPDVKVFIDSGAHTFLANMNKFKTNPDSFWNKYLAEYTEWVRENKEYVFACADLDIDYLVGEEKVDDWRKRFFEPLEQDGVQVCYIWHENRGQQGWEEMCRKYSYVGFSAENDDSMTLQKITKMLNVARKHNTRVHGMALTKSDILVRVPFYSADSTTWIVGQQYGELNWFDGRGMKRLSKTQWQRDYKTKLLREPFNADWEKLMTGMGGKGDTYELLRLNVLAFKIAEEHIRKRLKARMYWLKSNGAVGHEAPKSIDDVNIPDYEWFTEGDQDDYKDYLKGLNLPQDMEKGEAVDLLYNFHLYVHEDEEHIAETPDQDLIDYASDYIGTKVDTREDAVLVIKQFYRDNATGVRKDFVTEDEEALNTPKERDKYLEDDEFMTIDLDQNSMALMLPPPKGNNMPEVEEYDKELNERGITIVRDSNGRFIKGQQKVRKPKSVYSDKFPKLACDTCYKSGECPQYKAGYVCAFNKMFKKFNSRDLNDVVDALGSLVEVNIERTQRAIMFEKMDGGMADPNTSALIDQTTKLLMQFKDITSHTPKAVLRQTKTLKDDGSEEVVTEATVSNPTGGGILSRIFGATTEPKRKEAKVEVVDADFTEE